MTTLVLQVKAVCFLSFLDLVNIKNGNKKLSIDVAFSQLCMWQDEELWLKAQAQSHKH